MKFLTFILALLMLSVSYAENETANYPKEWWKEFPREEAKGWEILPQDAKPGEVILSKRTELGVFSNLAFSSFELDGIRYHSIEGLWQGMKYPDPELKDDPRLQLEGYPHKRSEVYLMADWDSKNAGTAANSINKKAGINWISYKDKKFDYRDLGEGSSFHLELITRATRAKVIQNPKIKELLKKTKGLILKPDHKQNDKDPASYRYYDILMKIRDEEIK